MKKTSANSLSDLSSAISQLSPSDYSTGLYVLNNNSIGKHVRHILEMFECLIESEKNGTLNYDNRKRCLQTETYKDFAIEKMKNIYRGIENLDLNKKILLKQNFDGDLIECESNMRRELLYNIEHCIHHLAIIRIGIEQNFPYVKIPKNFGIAHSTLQSEKS